MSDSYINDWTEQAFYYYKLSDILMTFGYSYKPTDEWIQRIVGYLNDYYDMSWDITNASVFYRALGLKLEQGYLFIGDNISSPNDELCLKLSRILNKSENIISGYLDEYNLLNSEIKAITSKSTTRFNDTPTEEGDYSTSKYTSTITQSENSVDVDVPTQINILTHKIDSLIEKYCKEFEEFIIYG